MATATTDSSNTQEKPKTKRRSLSFFLMIAFTIAVVGYFTYNNSTNSFINHNFYRVLFESSEQFNVNLTKLKRMLEGNQSTSSIRSQLPSYKELNEESSSTPIDNFGISYQLKGEEIFITQRNKNTAIKHSKISIYDVLPKVKEGFSQYILADKDGNVLASNGGENTISFVNLNNISKKMAEQNTSYNFSNKKLEADVPLPTLPSFSSHVDMTLSYDKFRIFIFPFKLSTQLKNGYFKPHNKEDNKKGDAENNIEIFESLYLVALLPKHKLSMAGTGHWNISLLIVMSVSLWVTVAMLRLFLLPQNHSITKFFKYFVIGSSYVFFLTIMALYYSYLQNTYLKNTKDDNAHEYAQSIANNLKEDLTTAFIGLNQYRYFYLELLKSIEKGDASYLFNSNNTQVLELSSISTFNKNIDLTSNHEEEQQTNCIAGLENKENKVVTPNNIKDKKCIYEYLSAVSSYEQPKKDFLSFYGNSIKVKISNKKKENSEQDDLKSKNFEIETYLKSSLDKGYFPNNILNVLVVNKDANTALPSIYYRENNALPRTINLSHREYFKNIRDDKAWKLKLSNNDEDFNSVFIQRLRNINNGSRGTTISMPLSKIESEAESEKSSDHDKAINKSKSYVLGADILLPSVDFGKPKKEDFTYMVVDRNTGEVLFHSDESRSMVENLFYAGDNESSLAQWIKAGFDINENKEKNNVKKEIISGHYHGQAGRFFAHPTIVPSWSVVVFYPNDSLDALMTSQFLYIFTCALLLMCLFMLLCFLPKWIIQHIPQLFGQRLPPKAYNRNLFLILSIVISWGFGYHVISIINADSINRSTFTMSQLPFAINIILITTLLTFIYSKFTMNRPIRWNIAIHFSDIKGFGFFNRFIILMFLILLAQLSFLSRTANLPLKSLQSHYQKGFCQQVNLEKQEIAQKALILFPNSITQHAFKAKDILMSYVPNYSDSNTECNDEYSEIKPGDSPNLSTLLGTRYFWQWMGYYFSNEDKDTTSSPKIRFSWSNVEIVAFGGFFILFLLGWIEFNRQVLWRRLYCPTKMLQHIQKLSDSVKEIKSDSPDKNLEINCQGIKLNGVDLNYFLNSQLILKPATLSPFIKKPTNFDIDKNTKIQHCFAQLFSISAFLQTFHSQNRALPNLKIDIKTANSENISPQNLPLFDVDIWDIEVCLDEPEHRQHLLALIMEFKSLTLAKQINSFTIYAGFHSLQRVEMKNLLSIEHSSLLEHAEYLSWAECLMDFKMNIPASLKEGIDKNILSEELTYFPELSYLNSEPVVSICNQEKHTSKEVLFGDPLTPRSISEWSTLKYILLHAEPLYRFKWELCTSAEKLGLFNLAKQRKLNPKNTKMIEHLALNGLIKVEDDHLALVNKSFAQFVLYAETNETIAELEMTGEYGVWKSYRVPLALLIILIIGGVAMTSGQSIYIIAASLLGIITTIASVTNSANLLKNQLK